MWAAYLLFGAGLTLMSQWLIAALKEERRSKNLALNTRIIEVCGTTYVHSTSFRHVLLEQNEKISRLQQGLASLQNPILKKKGSKNARSKKRKV